MPEADPNKATSADPGPQDRLSVPDLAARLADVITERGLVAGDRFLTTEQAARLLRVRRDLANRALQVLVQRGRIERSQRIGARVLEPQSEAATFARVHVVVQANHPRVHGASSPAMQVGLHAALPGSEVDIAVVPTGAAESYFEPLVRRVLQQPRPEGLVLVRCDYATQRLAAQCGLPVVLHGSPYAGIDLPSLDVDGRQMGRLQAQSLIERGCERIVVVRRDRALPGDRAFLQGLREVAGEQGFACHQLDELQLAPYPEVVAAELDVLFREPAKLGIVCASRELADATWTAAQASPRTIGTDLWLHSNRAGHVSGPVPFPCLMPLRDDEQQGRELGELLASRLADPTGDAEHRLVPCELVYPEDAS